jgi:argininosuccinate lyase
VRFCEQHGIELSDLTAEQLAGIDPRLTAEVRGVLTVQGSIDSRTGRGGTATARVKEQLGEITEQLAKLRR